MKLLSSNKRYSIIDVDPDDLAAQLTLIDLPIFKSIQRAELTSEAQTTTTTTTTGSCNGVHGTRRRHNSTPNISAMKRQFNQVSFWVVGQVLAYDTARQRAEIISHFIKTAKRLYLLNNLHSSNAIVSALLSSPIYRLERTWQCVNKKYPKDKIQFNWLRQLYSDTNNYESLRAHLAACDLPCIPYLGMYSRDIIYITEAHQEGTIQRTRNTSKILESIEKFQSSEYDQLVQIPSVYSSLLTNRYIDELQRFIEDENYRRSLELEPPDTVCCLSGAGGNQPAIDRNCTEAPGLHHSASATSLVRHNGGAHGQQGATGGHHSKRSTMLAGLTSMVHSAVVSTASYRFGGGGGGGGSSTSTSPTHKLSGGGLEGNNAHKALRYLIDDSFIHNIVNGTSRTSSSENGDTVDSCYAADKSQHHTSLPSPISTSS